MKTDEESGRTRLYPLSPIRRGSSEVEGLDSYLIRLAGEHCVSPRDLIRRVLLPVNPELHGVMANTFWTKDAATLCGLGPYAQRFVLAFESLSSRRDFSQLTLLPLRNLFSENSEGLIAHTKRWCPLCLKESALEQQPTYRPLCWSLKLYSVCHRHGVALQERCAHCGGKQAFIPRWPVIDRCDQCGSDLAAVASAADTGAIRIGNLATAAQIADLICAMNWDASADNFRLRLTELIADVADGNRARFCRHLGLPRYMLKNWFVRRERPSLPQFLRLCCALELPPRAFLGALDNAKISAKRNAAPRLLPRARRQLMVGSIPDLQQRLEALLRCDPPRSLRNAAAVLGITVGALRYRWPRETELLRTRHRDYLLELQYKRRERVRSTVGEAVTQLASEGRYPSRRQLERRLRARGLSLWQPDVRSWYVTIRDEN